MALLEKVIETKHGFRVESARHKPIVVTFEPTFIKVEAQPENDQVDDYTLRQLENTRFGFYQYYDFSRHIGKCIAADWQRPEREGEEGEPTWLRPWKAKKETCFIGKEVHHLWQQALKRIDPVVLAAHRQVFAACGRQCCDLIMDRELYRYPYIAGDIGQYRAAAIAAMNVYHLARQAAERRAYHTSEALEIRRQLTELRARANRAGLDFGLNMSVTENALDDHDLDDLGALENWRGLFSYSGQSYRSLNRTLMNLPGNIPHGFVCDLNKTVLTRPYTERLELLALLFGHNRTNNPVFAHARAPQVKEAIKRVAAHLGDELSARRCKDVKTAVGFLADFPERHTGNVVGLADKAIVWHRAGLQENRDREIAELGAETKALMPPIPLPETPGVTFLDTVGAICQEGADMGHCVGSYASRAVKGVYFLFHVEHDGDRATIQVDYQGGVVQAHGPRNQSNGAARWGRRVLRQWGRQFPEDNLPLITHLPEGVMPF